MQLARGATSSVRFASLFNCIKTRCCCRCVLRSRTASSATWKRRCNVRASTRIDVSRSSSSSTRRRSRSVLELTSVLNFARVRNVFGCFQQALMQQLMEHSGGASKDPR